MPDWVVNLYMIVSAAVVILLLKKLSTEPDYKNNSNVHTLGRDEEKTGQLPLYDTTNPANCELYPTHPAYTSIDDD